MQYTKKVQKFEDFEQVYENSNYDINEEDDLLYSDERDEYSDFDDEDDFDDSSDLMYDDDETSYDDTDDYSDFDDEEDDFDTETSDISYDDDEDGDIESGEDDFDSDNSYDYEDDEDGLMDSYDYDEDDEFMSESALKQSAKDRKRGSLVSALMRSVNKDERYITARDKFVEILQKVAKDVVTQEKMKPTVLKMLNKVTLKEINA